MSLTRKRLIVLELMQGTPSAPKTGQIVHGSLLKSGENNCCRLNGVARDCQSLLNPVALLCFDSYKIDYSPQQPNGIPGDLPMYSIHFAISDLSLDRASAVHFRSAFAMGCKSRIRDRLQLVSPKPPYTLCGLGGLGPERQGQGDVFSPRATGRDVRWPLPDFSLEVAWHDKE